MNEKGRRSAPVQQTTGLAAADGRAAGHFGLQLDHALLELGVEGEQPGLGRTVRGLKVSADELPEYVERVVRRFVGDREQGETFSAWAKRSDEQALR